uniref:Uncharacterized protein n=1 Tax=Anopheles epiroticus TaxID=199890 RepID=A0A182PQT5_9DIPT
MDTKNSVKKGSLDELPNPAPIIPNLSSGDASKTKKPEGEIKEGVVGEGDGAAVAPKLAEKAQKEPSPVQLPQEAVAPEKNEGDLEQQQGGGMDGIAGDLAPFDDEPKQPVDQDAKGGTQPVYENSDESDGIASAEDVNENGDDLEINGFQPVAKPEQPEKEKQEELADGSKASDIVPGADPFYEQKDSNFFPFFLFVMFFLAMLYVAYHNKTKLLALVLEGWRTNSGRRGFSKGRKHTAAYRKLDSNLEEAITSGSSSGGHSSTQIIY